MVCRLVRGDGQPERYRRDGRASAGGGQRAVGRGAAARGADLTGDGRGLARLSGADRRRTYQPAQRSVAAGRSGARRNGQSAQQQRGAGRADADGRHQPAGRWHPPGNNWDAATRADPAELRRALALLPELAAEGASAPRRISARRGWPGR